MRSKRRLARLSLALGILTLGCAGPGKQDATSPTRQVEAVTAELDATQTRLKAAEATLAEYETRLRALEAKGAQLTAALAEVSAAPEARPEVGERPGVDAESPEGPIVCSKPLVCTVDRAWFTDADASGKLLRQARVIPSLVDGETKGFKLYGMRRASLPARLGLKNGDLLTQIEDRPLGSMEEALAVYAAVKKADKVDFTIVRAGEAIHGTLTFVDGSGH